MTELDTSQARPLRPRIEIGDDVLVPRREFAADIGVAERTVTRMNLPTTYIGGMAYVARKGSLQEIAGRLRRRHEPVTRRRSHRASAVA